MTSPPLLPLQPGLKAHMIAGGADHQRPGKFRWPCRDGKLLIGRPCSNGTAHPEVNGSWRRKPPTVDEDKPEPFSGLTDGPG
jgi:hypothetical protein